MEDLRINSIRIPEHAASVVQRVGVRSRLSFQGQFLMQAGLKRQSARRSRAVADVDVLWVEKTVMREEL